MHRTTSRLELRALVVIAIGGAVACGSSNAKPVDNAAPSAASTANTPASAAADTTADGGVAATAASSSTGGSAGATDGGAPGAPGAGEHPLAKTPSEATTMIDDVIDKHDKDIGACVHAARTRNKNAHAEITVDIGIDEQGTLIGVKNPKGHKVDPAMNQCILTALKGAAFPRSNAGVITVHKTFSDKVIYTE